MKTYDVGVYVRKLIIAEHNPKAICYGFHVVIDGNKLYTFPSVMLLQHVSLHEIITLNNEVESYIDDIIIKKASINEVVARELTKVVDLSPNDLLYLKNDIPEMIVRGAISKAQIRTFLLSAWAKQYGFKKSPEYILTLCNNLYIINAELPIGEYELSQDIY